MPNKRMIAASLIALGYLGAVSAQAQSTTPAAQPATPPAMNVENSAQSFVSTAAISDMYEIQAGKIAEARAQSKAVKAFARHMVRAHTQTTASLKATLKAANLSAAPPDGLDTAHQKMIDQLNAASGADFDRMYISQQATAHQDALTLLHTYATSGDNKALKTFANRTIPIVQQHIKMIDKLKS